MKGPYVLVGHSSAGFLIRAFADTYPDDTAGLVFVDASHEDNIVSDVEVISQRLGHSSIGFTLDTYAHVLPSADKETAHTLARHILEASA